MPLEILLSDDQLAKPGVGRALADMFLALGGALATSATAPKPAPEPPAPAPAPTVVEVKAPPAAPAKAPVAKIAAVVTKAKEVKSAVKAKKVKSAVKAKEEQSAVKADSPPAKAKPTRRRKASKAAASVPQPKVPWPTFVSGLSRNTRIFLDLLESRGRLTISAAQEALAVAPKGVGGITGALARKAQNYEMPLPFSTAHPKSGQRMWIWRPKIAAQLGIQSPSPEGAASDSTDKPTGVADGSK